MNNNDGLNLQNLNKTVTTKLDRKNNDDETSDNNDNSTINTSDEQENNKDNDENDENDENNNLDNESESDSEFNSFSVVKLKSMCKERGLKNFNSLRKPGLISLLEKTSN